jgi:hypothetical protein
MTDDLIKMLEEASEDDAHYMFARGRFTNKTLLKKARAHIIELEAALKIFVLTPTFQLTNGESTTTAIVVFEDDLKKAASLLGINIDLRAARAAHLGEKE